MKKIKLATVLAAMTLATQVATADEVVAGQVVHVWEDPRGWWGNHFVYGPAVPQKFTANEFSIDLFGSFWAGQRKIEDVFKTDIRSGKWGGGVGVNYFLTRNIGISGDMNMSDNDGNLVDNVAGSLVLRLPFETTGLSPYIFGGGGRMTDRVWEWEGHGGIGLEWRVNPITGLFADARYIWPEDSSDSLLIRAGLRFVF